MCYNGHQLSQVLQLQEAAHHLHSVLPAAPSAPLCRACYSRSRHFRVMETDISLHSSYLFSDSILACRGGPVCFSFLHPSSCSQAKPGEWLPLKSKQAPHKRTIKYPGTWLALARAWQLKGWMCFCSIPPLPCGTTTCLKVR